MNKTIYLTDANIYKLAQAKAKREGKSISQVIQELLTSYVTQNKKKPEKPLWIG